MTTLAQLIEETRRYLMPERRETVDKLSGSLTDSATSLSITYGENLIARGKRLSIDLEDILIWDGSNKTASVVQRAVGGSTASTHDDGSLVYVDAPFTSYEIAWAINRKLSSLPGEGVFRWPTVDLTASAARVAYDLDDADDAIAVHDIYYETPGLAGDWRPVARQAWSADLAANTTDFPSGISLTVNDSLNPGSPFRVLYKAPFSQLTLTTAGLSSSVESVSGIADYAVTLLPLGAAILLTLGRAVERSAQDSQGQTRRPEEVSGSDARLSSTPLLAEYQQALTRVRREQLRRYGP